MNRVIITGASGFIGKALTRKLIQAGVYVVAVVRNKDALSDVANDQLLVVEADFSKYSSLASLIPSGEYDCFFHLAWTGYGNNTNNHTIQIQNIAAACDAVSSAAELRCKRFVFASSFSEYMIMEDSPLSHNEGAACNVYGATKESARLLCQAVALQSGLSMSSVAFSNTFGPGDYSHRTPNLFIHRFLNNIPVSLTPANALYEWTYIDDALNALVLAAKKGLDNRVYYVRGCGIKPLRDIVEEVKNTICQDGIIQYGVYQEKFICDYSCIDPNLLAKDTGYEPMWDLSSGIKKTVQWLKAIDFK